MRNLIIREKGQKVYDFIIRYITPAFKDTLVISTTTRFNVDKQPDNAFRYVVNLRRINDIRYINEFFGSVNSKLPPEGLFICSVETKNMRKKRIFRKYPVVLNYIYYFFDFILKRVLPKLPVSKQLYFAFTGGRNRVLSKTETLGRLYSCGFEYVGEKVIDKYLYLVMKKAKDPVYDKNASYGPIFRMRRVGKGGKIIHVYKLRTMHAYSEYLQQFIYEKYKLADGGKFRNDIRITSIGRILRKFWIDEIPSVINLLKGDLKIVGVRPLSEQYLTLYNEDLKQLRMRYKPGLIPPFYADLPKTMDEIMESEMRYLQAYQKNRILTDFRYFWKALYNILVKRARSR